LVIFSKFSYDVVSGVFLSPFHLIQIKTWKAKYHWSVEI
jgi:hypothetical protein